MKRVFAILFALVLGSAAMAAQAIDQDQPRKFDPKTTPATATLQVFVPPGASASSCPVIFNARQGGGAGGLISVKPGQPQPSTEGYAQRIHLSTVDGKSHVIAATVRVHGLTPQPRYVPVDSGMGGPAKITRTLQVTFSPETKNEVATDLVMRDFTAVLSIDVESLTYADGSTWKSGPGVCRVVPDPMMLIGAR
jgi:hypothetical protein